MPFILMSNSSAPARPSFFRCLKAGLGRLKNGLYYFQRWTLRLFGFSRDGCLIVENRYSKIWTWHYYARSTSRVEGAHWALKRRLKVSIGDLKHVVDELELMMRKQISEHKYKLNSLKIRHVQAHQIMLFE